MKFYISQETKEELQSKIAELENTTELKLKEIYKEILSNSVVLPAKKDPEIVLYDEQIAIVIEETDDKIVIEYTNPILGRVTADYGKDTIDYKKIKRI
ncbi:MAG: hypothetical protein QXL18_05065 [Candidatus Woesearchaeota archaeon]